MKDSWTSWKFFQEERLKEVPSGSGVYEFRSLDKTGAPLPVQRLRGKDKRGIIYIGQSSNLRQRISGFWKTLENPKRSRHAAGWTYVAFRYERVFSQNSLQFRYKVLRGDPTVTEFDLLLKYRRKLRDLPPLNATRSKYPRDWKRRIKAVFGRMPPSE